MPRIIAESPEFAVSPKVAPESWSSDLIVTGDYEHTRLLPDHEYTYELSSMFFRATGERRKSPISGKVKASSSGTLSIPFEPDITGEWLLTVDCEADKRKTVPFTLALYVLPASLESFRPYLGDLHSHSTGSDGSQEPSYMPMRARTFGYDFFALTDHWNYQTSQRMIEQTGTCLGTRMLLLNGEEMHPERDLLRQKEPTHFHHYHYVAVGHNKSVRDAYLSGGEAVQEEVRSIADELSKAGVAEGLDVIPYAEGVWKVRKAREFGGLTVFAHPYWATPVNLDAAAIDQSFADREVDAVEAISVADDSSYMVNRMLDIEREKRLPVVGVSDTHNWNELAEMKSCTLLFSEELSRSAVIDAIRAGRSVACRMTDPPELVGQFELVDFASFYLHRILPIRRRITEIQGNLALSGLRGGAFSQDIIDALDADLRHLDESIWRRK